MRGSSWCSWCGVCFGADAKKDAAKSNVKVRLELRTMDFCDFLQEFDVAGTALPTPPQQPQQPARPARGAAKSSGRVAAAPGARAGVVTVETVSALKTGLRILSWLWPACAFIF